MTEGYSVYFGRKDVDECPTQLICNTSSNLQSWILPLNVSNVKSTCLCPFMKLLFHTIFTFHKKDNDNVSNFGGNTIFFGETGYNLSK